MNTLKAKQRNSPTIQGPYGTIQQDPEPAALHCTQGCRSALQTVNKCASGRAVHAATPAAARAHFGTEGQSKHGIVKVLPFFCFFSAPVQRYESHTYGKYAPINYTLRPRACKSAALAAQLLAHNISHSVTVESRNETARMEASAPEIPNAIHTRSSAAPHQTQLHALSNRTLNPNSVQAFVPWPYTTELHRQLD